MPALNFPPQPQEPGNVYVGSNGVNYIWTGTIWEVSGTPGTTGNVTFSGNTIATGNDGDLVLQASSEQWTFGTDGNLTLPTGGTINFNDGSDALVLNPATTSVLGGVKLGEGFVLNASNQVTTSKLYSTNLTQPTQHYRLELDTNGVVILPDQSIINGSTLRAVAGSYAGLTTNDGENSWMWVDSSGAYIATEYSTIANQWTFGADGGTTFPTLTVPISDNLNPSGTGQTLKFSDSSQQAIIFGPASTSGATSAQRIIIQGAPGYTGTAGEGGDIYLWAGPGGSADGSGGDIKVRGGLGNGTGSGGYLNFQAGDSATGQGGWINIESGESGTQGQGGDITVEARSGGDIDVHAAGGGEITLSTDTAFGNQHNWLFGNNGNLTLPGGGIITDSVETVIISGAGTSAVNQTYGKISSGQYIGQTDSAYQIDPPYEPDFNYKLRGALASGYYESEDLVTWTIVAGAGGGAAPVPTGVIVAQHITVTVDSSDWRFDSTGNLTLPAGGTINYSDGSNALVGGGGVTDLIANGSANLTISSDGTLVLSHPDEPVYHPLDTQLVIEKAAGNYHIISGAYGLSLQATPVLGGYGDLTNNNYVDIFHDGISINVNDNTWGFDLGGNLTMPLVTRMNSGGIGAVRSAEFGTVVNAEAPGVINTSNIYMSAGTGEARIMSDANGNTLTYFGVEDPGFAGFVSMDAGVTSQYAVGLDANSNIILGATQPSGTVTTTMYTASIGAINGDYNINGLYADSTSTVVSGLSNVKIQTGGGNVWQFDANGTTTFPNNTLKTYTNSNLTVQTQVVYNITTITNGGTGYGSQSGTSTSGGSGTGMTVNVNQSGTVVDLVIVNNPGTGYQNGDTITILGGSGTATFTIANYSSTGSNGANNWNFGLDGNLTLPAGGTINYSDGSNALVGGGNTGQQVQQAKQDQQVQQAKQDQLVQQATQVQLVQK